MAERPSTPPAQAAPPQTEALPRVPLTPERVKNIEISRLKAKALRCQREAEARTHNPPPPLTRNASSNIAAGHKRPYSATPTTSSNVPATLRDGRSTDPAKNGGFRPLDEIQPARNFTKFVEYDFSKMTDTKGGFMTVEDDPHNKALHSLSKEEKPAHMTMKEWERHRLLRSLREQKSGPFEPGLSALMTTEKEGQVCRECGGMEIDWKWLDALRCAVCNTCREKLPDRYSLLTKTEAKDDYLLTDPELKDDELLPHLERPNPHKSTFHPMRLYVRYQVEEYAFSQRKWGSGENLDAEFEKREGVKKRRKEDRFREKLLELKKRTRVEAYRRGRRAGGGGEGEFGDELGRGGRHTHVWGRATDGEEEGVGVKTCVECGMEVEELEF